MRRSGPRGGFTLVELLATIGIMVFVLSITIIAFAPALRTAGVKDGARRLRVAIEMARIRAIQQRRHVRFEAALDNENPEQWVVSPNAGDRSYQWEALPEFVAVRTDVGGRSFSDEISSLSVTFAPDGSVESVVVDEGAPEDDPGIFYIRLETTRQITGPADEVEAEREALYRYVEVNAMTGSIRSLNHQEYADLGH